MYCFVLLYFHYFDTNYIDIYFVVFKNANYSKRENERHINHLCVFQTSLAI